jgi:hypothetical protein
MNGDLRAGTVLLDKYRVEGVLGRGGMGVVLRVTHLHLGEEQAIKILSPGAGRAHDAHARFLREAQSAVRLHGEHVARVSDVGVLPDGAPYMVMEYLRGGDLAGELARGRGALPPGEVVDYVLQACEALAEAHALGIVHRDIKPDNLFITRRPDGSLLVKVIDFGISKAPLAGPGMLTRTDAMMGTPGYMSPEQMKASKDVDARSDIWALGIVLYECLNGRRPFDAETLSAIVLRATTEPPPPMDPQIPRMLQAAILRCLEKDRAARFPSIAALAAALAPFARDRRSAEIIAERTAAMLRGPGASVPQPAPMGECPDTTTLNTSSGTLRAWSTRRYAIGGAALVLAGLAGLSIGGAMAFRDGLDAPDSAGSGTAAIQPKEVGSGSTVALPGASPAAVDAAPMALPVEAVRDVAPGPRRANLDAESKVKACTELEVNRRWQELRSCAEELAALDVHDRSVQGTAEEFRGMAVKEAASRVVVGKLTAAIAEGNLREAQKQLASIGPDSVYFAAASEAFRTAEAHAVDDNRRTAKVLAVTNDCASIRRLRALVDITGTPAVAGAVAAVAAKCVEGPATR